MPTATPRRVELTEWARRRRPLVLATLALAGVAPEPAARLVRRAARRWSDAEGHGEGDGRTEVERVVLADAAALPTGRVLLLGDDADDALERALRQLSMPDRLATVAAVVLETAPQQRPGVARLDELAAGLDAPRAHWVPTSHAGPATVEDRIRSAVHALVVPDPPEPFLRSLRRPRRWWRGAVVVGALAIALGVVGAVAGRRSEDPAVAQGSSQWVAVLGFAPGPFDLYPDAQAVGEVVGVYVFTDRWSCYAGWPALDAPAEAWFLGIAAPDRATLDGLVASVDRPVLAVAEVRATCLAPPRPDDLGVPTSS